MTCQEFIDFLLEYDEGRVPPDVRVQFESHLAICPDCVNYLSSYRTTIALGRTAFADPAAVVPEAVPAELIQAILVLRTTVGRAPK